ncbi:hypothetical protein PR048_015014, partial [Dryococelus australis]
MDRKPFEYNKVTVDPKVIRENKWNFQMKKNGSDVTVCREFVIDVHKVSAKRVRVVKTKILQNSLFEEKWAKETGKCCMAMEHLKGIPHHGSHYMSHTNRLYFDNSDLTIKGLCFKSTMKNTLANLLQWPTKPTSSFIVKLITLPEGRKQTCVTFARNAKKIRIMILIVHLSIKNDYIGKGKEKDDILTLGFDYAQNLPLPKINITKHFYKRLLWLFKNPNTVASFLFNYISEKVDKNPYIKEIVPHSDAAGGQNKTATMLRFCSWLSKTLGVPITHLYPVRYHLFGQCDRNFVIMKPNIKKTESIETLKPYLENTATCREKPEPFALVHDKFLLLDWDQAFTPYFEKNPKQKGNTFRIQQYCIIKYKTCGTIAVSKNYSSLIFRPYKFMLSYPTSLSLQPVSPNHLKKPHIKDITDLLPYLSEEN